MLLINLTIYVFQVIVTVIHNFHKHLNGMYTENTPLDHFVDHAIEHIKYMYDLKVRDLIFMTPLIHHNYKLDLKRVSSSGIQVLTERDRQLTPLPVINCNSLTQKEMHVFDNLWCISGRVEITNSKLN